MAPVDRSRTSPFLLRCFIRPQTHNEVEAFNPNSPALQKGEYGIYVWKDTTLRELVILLRSVGAPYQRPGNAKFSIRHIYASSSTQRSDDGPVYNHKDLGFVFARDLTSKDFLEERGGHSRRSDPSVRTLEQHRIIPGDYIDIAFITVAPSSSAPGQMAPTIPALSSNARPPLLVGNGPSSLLGRVSNGNGLSDADKAWGIAGDQTGPRRRPQGFGPTRTGGPNGANRFNPLLSGSNGAPVASGRGGSPPARAISIMGAGRRASAANDEE